MMILVMILVLSFEKKDLKLQTHSQALFCYGTTVGFSIIVSGEMLKKLFSEEKQVIDKMEILSNVLAVILFTVVGSTRVKKYKDRYSEEQMMIKIAQIFVGSDLSVFLTGKIGFFHHNIQHIIKFLFRS